jgi:hypothetical protein
MYLLDTDHIVILQQGESIELGHLLDRMAACPDIDFYYPIIAFHEQMLGSHAYIARAMTRKKNAFPLHAGTRNTPHARIIIVNCKRR